MKVAIFSAKKYDREVLNTRKADRLIPMRPKQAQPVEDYDDCAAFVTDHAGSEINPFCQRGNDQEQDYSKRKNDVLTNDRASAPAERECVLDILNLVVH